MESFIKNSLLLLFYKPETKGSLFTSGSSSGDVQKVSLNVHFVNRGFYRLTALIVINIVFYFPPFFETGYSLLDPVFN
ncbi:hypothetical protein SAMN04487995_5915 [Dyadobacter koreensis]|uniref:Uncharacterized protein n=1 Tax=Dyadobacter koreensis TaxID=408657 RepID=A0A1H7AXK5_9BACT|nr:hypothetical protein [Dyadobacter koreensis]SEJ68647.1 hypothetical protein SAMN04487995_5915 [Dyadobacter koreensis]